MELLTLLERARQRQTCILAVNSIRNRPYAWGGGHGSFHDYGSIVRARFRSRFTMPACSEQPLTVERFLRYGERGRGRWVTIYSRDGHVSP